jgi:hypothetical protein
MRYGFLKPSENIGGGSEAFFSHVVAYFAAQSQPDTTLPKAIRSDINFG